MRMSRPTDQVTGCTRSTSMRTWSTMGRLRTGTGILNSRFDPILPLPLCRVAAGRSLCSLPSFHAACHSFSENLLAQKCLYGQDRKRPNTACKTEINLPNGSSFPLLAKVCMCLRPLMAPTPENPPCSLYSRACLNMHEGN
eukprot:1155545-Pelagomonas_calceolata.AAC.17